MTADAGEDVEKKGHSSTAGAATLEISLVFPLKIGHSTIRRSSNITPGHIYTHKMLQLGIRTHPPLYVGKWAMHRQAGLQLS